jgi:hypothetical protein
MNAAANIDVAQARPMQIPLGERLDRGFADTLLPVYGDLREEILAYAGGIPNYIAACDAVAANGYEGFHFS